MPNPFLHLQKRTDLLDCCRNMLNLDVRQAAHLTLKATCRKCGRGHVKMKAERLEVALRGMGPMEQRPSGLLVPKG